MRWLIAVLTLGLAVALPPSLTAQPSTPARHLPVREATLFKDGHAFIFHEGRVGIDTTGTAVLDLLPVPVLGTFWAYSPEPGVRVASVLAGHRTVRIDQPVAGLVELLVANIGAAVTIRADSLREIKGTIEGVTVATPGAPGGPEMVLLRSGDGVRALAISRIAEVSFGAVPKRVIGRDGAEARLSVKLERSDRSTPADANLGLAYLQHGLRWHPSYRVELDGNGTATVTLEATIANDAVDLVGVPVNLVIGVPSFAFRGQIDPIALQETFAQVAGLLPDGRFGRGIGAAVAGQYANYRLAEREVEQPDDEPVEGSRTEDLFLFTVPGITLRKGERMTLPVARYQVKYRDVYALTVYHAAPGELQTVASEEQATLARQLARPTVTHRIRLTNATGHPFTTAPALILKGNRVLAQGTMTYTPTGGASDIDVTKAVDIQVDKDEAEVRRTAAATRWRGSDFARVDLTGSLTLTNRRDVPIEIEVSRYLLGHVDSAAAAVKRTRIHVMEDDGYLPPRFNRWWSWYSWPSWWPALNGVERIDWTVRLAPGATRELRFRWHYFWDS